MSSPAASIISLAVASAVDPKASSGTVSRTTVGEEVSAEKFSACSLDSMIRRNSRPPAPLAAADGMKNGSPAVAGIDSIGRAADDDSSGTAQAIVACSSGVPPRCAFSLHEQEEYIAAS